MKRFALLSLLAIAVLVAVVPASAQDAVDPAAVDAVAAALAATQSQSSLHLNTQVFTESNRGTDQAGISQQDVLVFDLAPMADGWNLAGSQTTSAATPMGAMDTVSDIIVLDGTVYLRLTSGGGESGGFGGMFPEGWFTLDSLEQNAGGQGRFGGFDATSVVNRIVGPLLLPVTADSVLGASELPADQIDGQAMRVIQITLDSQALIDSTASAMLGAGGGMMMMGGPGMRQDGDSAQAMPMLQGTPPAGGPDGQMPDGAMPPDGGMQALTPENVRMTFAVYIGQDDGLVHRLYAVTDQGSGDGQFSQPTTTRTDLSAFGAPVSISAPELSS